jgi:hypothetical protein
VFAVLVRFTDYTTHSCSHSFIADSTSRYYNHSITVDSDPLMPCVGAVCWCLPSSKAGYELGCLLAWLFFDSSYSLTICDWLFSLTECFFLTLCLSCRNPCLKAYLVGSDTEHLASPFIPHRNDIVASETCHACTLHSSASIPRSANGCLGSNSGTYSLLGIYLFHSDVP